MDTQVAEVKKLNAQLIKNKSMNKFIKTNKQIKFKCLFKLINSFAKDTIIIIIINKLFFHV